MGLSDTIRALLAARPRVCSFQAGRAVITYRNVPKQSTPALQQALSRAIRGVSGIAWVDVNPSVHCAVFAADSSKITLAALQAIVEQAEDQVRGSAPQPMATDDVREVPDDDLELVQRWVQLWADVAGLGYGLLLRLVPFAPATLGGRAVLLLSLVQSTPRLRRPLDVRLGRQRADLFLNLSLSAAQGLSQRPLSSIVDIARRASALRELRARRRSYERARAQLFEQPARLPLGDDEPRPMPRPESALEEYTRRAWVPAASAFSVSLLTTRQLSRATAAFFGALPRPAQLGYDVFVSELGRMLAERGMLVLSPSALRCLDRIDTLLVDRALLTHTKLSLGTLEVLTAASDTDLRARAEGLFDPRQPLAFRTHAGYQLAPLARTAIVLDAGAQDKALALQDRGSLVLALSKVELQHRRHRARARAGGGQVLALVELQIATHTGGDRLLELARLAGMQIALCTDAALETVAPFDGVDLLHRDDIVQGIRSLQRRGRTVCFMSASDSPGLAIADCAVAVMQPGEKPPLSADILCSSNHEDLLVIQRAALIARKVSEESVRVARATAVVNTLVASGAKRRSGRSVVFVTSAASLVTMFNAARKTAGLVRPQLPHRPETTPYHALETRAVIARLHTSQRGLDQAEATRRMRGRVAEPSLWRELNLAIAHELESPLTPFMVTGAGLSALVGSTVDASLVAAAGGFSALVAAAQRVRTERALRRLVKPARHPVRVLRAGAEQLLPETEIVVGDVVLLRAGEVVAADCRILESSGLEVDSASLTGESLPSAKSAESSFEANLADRSSMLYAGTTVVSGRAKAITVAVGDQVEALRGASTKQTTRRDSGVEARLKQLTQLTLPIAGFGAGAIVLSGLLRGRRPEDLIASGVSMGVAALPEGLPLLATAAQLTTAERLSRHGALVRNPRCIEALGRVDVVCIDKTGTLTEGLIELSTVAASGQPEQTLTSLDATGRSILAAALRATPPRDSGNTTDAATHRAALRAQVGTQLDAPGYEPAHDYPFASAHAYHAEVARYERGNLLTLKGAVERVLSFCTEQQLAGERVPLEADAYDELLNQAERMAMQGLRVLAVAERRVDETRSLAAHEPAALCFLGLLGFHDPVRGNAKRAVDKLRKAGVRVVMLTGDHIETARSIARDVALLRKDSALTGAQIAQLGDAELAARMRDVEFCARVTPAQKVRLVSALQERGHVVAMVGDGANDAPAMHTAHVGIAVGHECSEAAQVAADIVFADAGIDSLLEGIVDARAMWLSIRDAASILLGGNLGEIGFVSAAGFISGKPPLNPRQLLLVNLLTDIAPAMAVALRAPPQDVLEQLQDQAVDRVLDDPLDRSILVRAASTALGAGWAWGVGRATGTQARASTMALTALVGAQLGQTLLARGSDRGVVVTGLTSALLMAALVQTPGLSHFFGCRPLGPFAWATTLTASAGATAASVGLAAFEERLLAWLRARAARDQNTKPTAGAARSAEPLRIGQATPEAN